MGDYKQIDDISTRIDRLYSVLMEDPDRPYWQVELTDILSEFAGLVNLIRADVISMSISLNTLQEKLISLETRYSDLLYRMAERS